MFFFPRKFFFNWYVEKLPPGRPVQWSRLLENTSTPYIYFFRRSPKTLWFSQFVTGFFAMSIFQLNCRLSFDRPIKVVASVFFLSENTFISNQGCRANSHTVQKLEFSPPPFVKAFLSLLLF